MNNKTKLISTKLIAIYLICVIIIVVIQVIADKPIIQWGIIIPIIIFMVLVPIMKIFKEFSISKKLLLYISENNFKQVIKISKGAKFLHKNNLTLYEQQICYSLAVFFYENNDVNNFNYYLNKINNKEIIAFKYFWQSLNAYLINNTDDFNKKYELFINNECLYKKWRVAYDEYADILKLISDYTNSNHLNLEKYNYYKNRLTLNILIKIFSNIELENNE